MHPASWCHFNWKRTEETCQVNTVPGGGDEGASTWGLVCPFLALNYPLRIDLKSTSGSKCFVCMHSECTIQRDSKYVNNFHLFKSCMKRAMLETKVWLKRGEKDEEGMEAHITVLVAFSDLFELRNTKKLLHTDCAIFKNNQKEYSKYAECGVNFSSNEPVFRFPTLLQAAVRMGTWLQHGLNHCFPLRNNKKTLSSIHAVLVLKSTETLSYSWDFCNCFSRKDC